MGERGGGGIAIVQCQIWFEINVGQPQEPYTAADYRKLAEECFEWTREARDVSVREHYAKLGEIWLECAARAELQSAVLTPPEPTTSQKVASRAA